MVCPILFLVKNLFIGFVLTNDKFAMETVKHLLLSMRHQLVVLHNLSLFDSNPKGRTNIFPRSFKLIIGYIIYLIPTAICGLVILFSGSTSDICTELKAPFLLDNNFAPTVDMPEMYKMRQDAYYNINKYKYRISCRILY